MWLSTQILLSPLSLQIVLILLQIDFTNKDLIENTGSGELDWKNQSQGGELTQAEKHTIEQLRQLMGDKLQLDFEKCDDFLIRWLQECDLDLTCASERLKDTLKWRRSELQEIVQPNKTFLTAKEDPTLVQGHTKNGGPIMVFTYNTFDLRKLTLSGHQDNLLKNQVLFLERYFQASIRRTENGEIKLIPGILIINGHGVTLKQHTCSGCIRFYQDFIRISQTHYPRITKLAVTINGPAIARPILRFLKSLLNEYLAKAFMVFGPEKEEWSPFLLKYITKENLMEEFGGNMIRNM